MPALARAMRIPKPFFTRLLTAGKTLAILKMEERSINTLLDKGKIDAALVLRQVRLFLAKRGELTLYRLEDVDVFLQAKMNEAYKNMVASGKIKHNYSEKPGQHLFWTWRPLTSSDVLWEAYSPARHGVLMRNSVGTNYVLPQRVKKTTEALKGGLTGDSAVTTHVSDYVSHDEVVDPFLAVIPAIARPANHPGFSRQLAVSYPDKIPMLIVAHWNEPDFKALPDRW